MKRLICLILALVLLLLLCSGCRRADETVTLRVFAAASLTETLTQLGGRFQADHPGVKVEFTFDSSGTLLTQIKEGAECDLFLSAAQKQMDALDPNAGGTDAAQIDPETRVDLLENQVALAVPDGNPKGIDAFDELAAHLLAGDVLLAMGNADVPVGQYTQKIFAYYGIDEAAVAGCLSYGSNVKEVTTQVGEASVDCGIIYRTDAVSAGLTVVDTATAEMCGQVIYPAAVLQGSANHTTAKEFLAFLQTDEAGAVFASVGFRPLS